MVGSYSFARIPQTHIGPGSLKHLIPAVKGYGLHHVIITGSSSFKNSIHWYKLEKEFMSNQLTFSIHPVRNEPTPEDIDTIVKENAGMKPASVVAIGGGSVIDAGKAVSAMLPLIEPVKNYIEGVGTLKHPGVKIPFFAVPTTAGTGSEATKNAVLSEIGKNGFKKSLRHDHFVPDIAIIDPLLQVSCPRNITASSGLDAITQLMEAYVSTGANTFTDSICERALQLAFHALPNAVNELDNKPARGNMAYAAFISGIALASAGLGTVHGFASSIGGRFKIPHGIICGSLLPETTRFTILQLSSDNHEHPSLKKYEKIGRMLTPHAQRTSKEVLDVLVEKLSEWTTNFELPKFGTFGMSDNDIHEIVEQTGQKNNPCKLKNEYLVKILKNSL